MPPIPTAIAGKPASTFAWYQSSSAASVNKDIGSGTTAIITADSDIAYSAGDYVIRFTYAASTAKNLYLSELNTDTLVTYFVDAQGKAHASGDASSGLDYPTAVLSKKYAVTATLYAASDTEFETPLTLSDPAALAAFHAVNTNFTATFSAAGADAKTPTPNAYSAYCAVCEENTAEGSYVSGTTAVFTVNPSSFASGNWTGAATVVGYFLVRCNGSTTGSTSAGSDSTVTVGNVTVTISVA